MLLPQPHLKSQVHRHLFLHQTLISIITGALLSVVASITNGTITATASSLSETPNCLQPCVLFAIVPITSSSPLGLLVNDTCVTLQNYLLQYFSGNLDISSTQQVIALKPPHPQAICCNASVCHQPKC